MVKHHGESSKMVQAGPLLQAAAGGLQVQTHGEFGYSPRVKEAPYEAPTRKKSHKERLTTAETRLDVLESSVEELYQGQQRLFGVESSLEEAESRIEEVESLIDQLTEDTKDSVRYLHEVVAELIAKVSGMGILEKGWPVGRWIGFGGSRLRFRADLGLRFYGV
ncbi:hypothetical protein B296_00037716 [Ensete ventricosum]|uniref:Uncharacterized protein n=1 Tax=Ensete ventricosum TaxID=4639 RepID=A0A426X3P1_ENSVE|nr:hypothetical protein B296_00037716 [Ensete ventricosum]